MSGGMIVSFAGTTALRLLIDSLKQDQSLQLYGAWGDKAKQQKAPPMAGLFATTNPLKKLF